MQTLIPRQKVLALSPGRQSTPAWKKWVRLVLAAIVISAQLAYTSTLRGCGGLERTDFLTFFSVGVVVLEDLIFNSLYIWMIWWS